MSMIYTIQQASDSTIEALHSNPELIRTFINRRCPDPPKKASLLARLFGYRNKEVENVVASTEFETVAEYCDLDKAWHGLHFLFTRTDWDGDPPAAFLLNWGMEIGNVDVGYGAARSFSANKTAAIHAYLQGLSESQLRRNFDPKKMMQMEIYPMIWDRDSVEDDTLGYLLETFHAMSMFISKSVVLGNGLVVHLA